MSSDSLAAGFQENPVRARLRSGKPAIGITITTNSVETAAQAAALGFDFLWIEMEHSPVSLETLRNVVLATRGLKAVPFVRVPVNELWTAKRVMDCGVMGVIFPFTSNAELARRAAMACKYPPQGRRGSGAGLAAFRWPSREAYYDFSDRNMVVITVIEEAAAIEHIDEIASTPGIDVIFIGPSDLAFSLGLRGRQDDPALDAAIAKVAAAAHKHGKYLGRPAKSAQQVKEFMAQGFSIFQAPSELALMTSASLQLLEPLGVAAELGEARLPY